MNSYLNRKKLDLLLISSIYLVFSSLEMQRRIIQTKKYCNFFYSVQKAATRKSPKVAAIKTFSPVCMLLV